MLKNGPKMLFMFERAFQSVSYNTAFSFKQNIHFLQQMNTAGTHLYGNAIVIYISYLGQGLKLT